MSSILARDLLARLASLRSRDPDNLLFGACQHRHLAFSVVSGQELEAFERSQGIELPVEYRELVSQVSSGGVGPGYGLYALRAPTSIGADPTCHRSSGSCVSSAPSHSGSACGRRSAGSSGPGCSGGGGAVPAGRLTPLQVRLIRVLLW